ncbi:MAG TPA: 1,6-anhydro-N-acetylmuramyl-L-alanine amidase AmpD [Thiobacillaceae bacterium]|nr:1,6-anhydro-N-acetylmuramyl-L-alanine amidase AmpD [Thiobacillaceae bacterium]
MKLSGPGVLEGVRYIASPHSDFRPVEHDIRLLVIHNISLPPGEFAGRAVEALFTGRLDWDAHPYFQSIRGLKVSAHFFIRRDGELIQFVACSRRAWHAGASSWQGRERCNDFSIGIELEGADDVHFTDAQYQTLLPLIKTLKSRYPIADIVGHSDIAPGRKTDPGALFDWSRAGRSQG